MYMEYLGNTYKDSQGNPTNGATTGPHLHLTIKKEGQLIDPLSIIKLINNGFMVDNIYKERMNKFFFEVENGKDILYETIKES